MPESPIASTWREDWRRLLAITPMVALAFMLPMFPGVTAAMIAAVVGFLAALLVGGPLLLIARSLGARHLWQLVLLGLTGASVSAPLLLRAWTLSPELLGPVLGIGAASAAIWWLVSIPTGERVRDLGRTAAVVGIALVVSAGPTYWPADTWPKGSITVEQARLVWAWGAATNQDGVREVRTWFADDPECQASIDLPALDAYLTAEHPVVLTAEIRYRSHWLRPVSATGMRLGPVELPAASSAIQGCHPWNLQRRANIRRGK